MKILITSGPTRQYIDPVRYLSNASSGRMGSCLAEKLIELGHEVVIVSGPVTVDYPEKASVIPVVSTDDMLEAAKQEFDSCIGMIGAAAPCDYRPQVVSKNKIKKSGDIIQLELVETPDVVATLGRSKRSDQWTVGFALETEDAHFRAITKLHRKNCDLVVLNGVSAIDSSDNSVDVFDQSNQIVLTSSGTKIDVAGKIVSKIDELLIKKKNESN
jgi:phosphopantothenoylcysteine decarboxylase/phosphopantothenate--cysteine ligase